MSMLLDNEYVIIPQLRFTLTYANDIRKVVTVKTNDVINCFYKKDGTKANIIGKVVKIGCNFNSSLGTVGTTAYMQVDGSSDYEGQVEYIQPSNVIDMTIVSTTDEINNVVCSVDNEEQRVSLIRENEVGAFQYSINGQDWKGITAAQGKSAYECAVDLGYEGSEQDWLNSLKGPQGPTGEAGSTRIEEVYETVEEMSDAAMFVKAGQLVALQATPSSLLYVRNKDAASTVFTPQTTEIDGKQVPVVQGFTYVGELALQGEQGPKGDPGAAGTNGKDGANGKSAYECAKEGGYKGSEVEFNEALGRIGEQATYDNELNASSTNAVQNKVIYAKIKELESAFTGSGDSPVVLADTYYGLASKCDLTHTVAGSVRLVIYGETKDTMESKAINSITFSDDNENEKTLQFPEPVVLRSVPNNAGSCPNVIIDGKPHIADFIAEMDGQIGVTRRVKYVESYAGECILGDWLSSTGALDLGATVQYAVYGTFEPFDEDIQEQYRLLRSYEGSLHVRTMEDTNISITYPIDVITYVNDMIEKGVTTSNEEYINRAVKDTVAEVVGEVPDEQTVVEYVDAKIAEAITPADDKIGTLPDGKNTVMEVIGTLPEGKDVATAISDVEAKITEQVTPVSTKANANETAINTLNANSETPGSVDYKVAAGVTQAKGYADSLASNYATAAQGTLATTALQPENVVESEVNGSIKVGEADVAVHGLKSAAYAETTEFATAAQGALADTALQPDDITEGATDGTLAVNGSDVAVHGLKSAAYAETTAFEVAGAAAAVEAKLGDLGESGTVVKYVQDAIAKAINELVDPPTYTAPTVSITSSEGASKVVETGTMVTPAATATFTQNDAGALTEIKIQKDGEDVPSATNSSSPYEWTGTEAAATDGDTVYTAVATYAQGELKKDGLGRDYPEGRIEAGSVTSADKFTVTGKRKVFYGCNTNAEVITPDGTLVRGLSDGKLDYNAEAPNSLELTLGATMQNAILAIPAPMVLNSATSGEESTNVLEQFVLTSDVQVNDASGANPVNYNVYILHAESPAVDPVVYTLSYGPVANMARVRRSRKA